jgi:DNA-binding MarR family transcriptional regulator
MKGVYALIMKTTNPTQPPPAKPDIGLCAHANLRKAMRVVSQAYDAALRPCRLKATQFTLLAVLAGRGEMPLTKLSDILVMDRTTLSRNLKPLLAQGFLEIGREKDERIRLVSITQSGRDIVDRGAPLWRDAQSRVVDGLGEARLAGMINDLNALVEAVRIR